MTQDEIPTPSEPSPETPAAEPAAETTATETPEAEVETAPKKGRGLLLWLLIGGGALLLLIAVGVIVFLTLVAQRSPEAAVERFGNALIVGDTTEALAQLDHAPTLDASLLTDEAYAASGGVTGYRIIAIDEQGLTADAIIDIDVNGEGQQDTLRLVRADTGPLTPWMIAASSLAVLPVEVDGPSTMAVTVNEIAADNFTDYVVFPGRYEIAGTDPGGMYDAGSESVTVPAFDTSVESPEFTISLTAEGEAAAAKVVKKYLAKCLSSKALAPPKSCGFKAKGSSLFTYSNIRWKALTSPKFEFETYEDGGWGVDTTRKGKFRVDADLRNAYAYGSGWTTISGYRFRGYVELTDDGTFRYVSLY